jgi:signal transduction histidine kinase
VAGLALCDPGSFTRTGAGCEIGEPVAVLQLLRHRQGLEMRSWFSRYTFEMLPKRSFVSFIVVVFLSVVLVLLAVLQYRWSGQASEAERERMQKGVNAAARQFQEQFYLEMLRVCAAFEGKPEGFWRATTDSYVRSFKYWTQTATHPKLVANLFLWRSGRHGNSLVLGLNRASGRFEAVSWPPGFEGLRGRLAVRGRPDPRRTRGPEIPPFGWMMAQEIPALVHPLFQLSQPRGSPSLSEPRPWGYVIVELNLEYLQGQLLPNLIQRFFGAPQDSPYQVTIVSRSQPPRIIYAPNAQEAAKDLLAGDALVDLLGARPEGLYPPWPRRELLDEHKRDRSERSQPVKPGSGITRDSARRSPRFGLPLLLPGSPKGRWQLVAKHKSGSLEAVVAAGRRRNLAISFGILSLLAVSAVMVFVSTMRARHLAKLQMEFVAGISHELRTPLAVICSAGDNLESGIVGGKEQMQRYGALIRTEGLRLTRMVQQILLFASSQAGRVHYELRPVQIGEVIDRVLADSAHVIETAGFSMERQIEPHLPTVLADPNALGHCLQNLVSNAVKYGGDRRWMGIRARKTDGVAGRQVQVIVEDKGLGIDPRELNDIFKPFYRSKSVLAAQIHGSGLGLTLAKSIAEAMGGSLSVDSTPGKGSAFTLHLVPLKQPEQQHQGKAG